MSDKEIKNNAEELKDEELGEVSGGAMPRLHVLPGDSDKIQTKMPSVGTVQTPVNPSTLPKTVKK